ncbi:MAG: hypothetical protein J7623_13660 [Chitinophaga sp.]|uniref:universal stress protein n=1 Tax=Chitinophaga sp. TaxID=1869181 RepID=UPI001B1685ED|nr:universal stress protein [Chitinophaga sp.]MBO9729678.1 hypothetical protein [Chitinophaga sp.]
MKKILLAIDGDNFSEGAFEFAGKMNEVEPIMLTGAFIPEPYLGRDINVVPVFMPIMESYAAELLERNIGVFKQQCTEHGISFNIHSDISAPGIYDLKKETRFSDLLLLGHEKFYGDLTIYGINEFLATVLHQAECPVIVVPEQFTFPESVILTYDGGASSTHAIRSFSYLFPQLCNKPAILVYGSATAEEIPELEKIKELASLHFSNLKFELLNADPRKYFDTWLDEIKSPIVVSGAYGRAGLSRIFKHSFIHDVMQEHKVPVYIDHR